MEPTELKFVRKETEGDDELLPVAARFSMSIDVPDLPDGDPADFEHWHKVARWTIEEATALSFRIEPAWVAWANVREWPYPCGIDYKKRLTLGLRAQQAGDLLEPSEPIAYIAWAKSVGIPIPTELETMVVAANSATLAAAATVNCLPEPTPKPKKQYKALNALADRESAVLVQLVSAVSAAFYEFDPQKDTSPVITEIINALALHGITLTRETASGWLHYAARVAGQADGLLRTKVKGSFCKLLGGMLRDHYGWLPTAEESHALTEEERAARAEKLREARAEELRADLAKVGMVVSVEDIQEALTFVDASI
jgi:hypothetical protein